MEKLNDSEINTAKSIIKIGLDKAGESLSFFMKEQVSMNNIDLNLNKLENSINFTNKNGENIHFLITEVIGELKGVCCLIFSEEEANQLRKVALSPEILNDPEMMAEMADAIMLEVDNIISASVITQFSNILNHKIYGGVPNLKKFNLEQLNEFVKINYKEEMYIINFKAHFISSNLNFNPEFVWLFDESFLNCIKAFSDQAIDK